MNALLALYLLGVPVAFALAVRDDRRKQPWTPWVDTLLMAFAAAVFWPVLCAFMACVVVAFLVRDARWRRGA